MAKGKKVRVLFSDDGDEQTIVAVFRKEPKEKKLVDFVGVGADSPEEVSEMFDNGKLFWEDATLY